MENIYKGPRPNTDRLSHDDAMWLIGVTCEAEDAAKELLAPYNPKPTKAALEACRYQLASVLLLQDFRGTERRMDVVLSLKSKIAAINERLSQAGEQDAVTKHANSGGALLQTAS